MDRRSLPELPDRLRALSAGFAPPAALPPQTPTSPLPAALASPSIDPVRRACRNAPSPRPASSSSRFHCGGRGVGADYAWEVRARELDCLTSDFG
jgi:hypothetical protein